MKKDDDKKIMERFKPDSRKNQEDLHINIHKSTSNPIRKTLLKLVHTELDKNKYEYKSFSRFKPDDMR